MDHVRWTVGCPSYTGHGPFFKNVLFPLLDLFKRTKGLTIAPLNTNGYSWKRALTHCTFSTVQPPIISNEALSASVSFM